MIYQEIKELLPVGFRTIVDVLKSRYTIAAGDNYTLHDVRNAIRSRKFVVLKGRKNLLVVGENPESMIVDDGNGVVEIPDSKIMREWTGEAVVVIDAKREDDENLFIFTPEKDEWSGETYENVIDFLSEIKIGEPYLPKCPIVISFKNKPEEKDIMAEVVGIEITIFDRSDPYTEIFHEIGHIYWRDVLTPEERDKVTMYQQTLTKENLPAIYTSRWGFSTPEEAFCTAYAWYLKGKYLSSGYEKILAFHDKEIYRIMISIFDRVLYDDNRSTEWDSQALVLANDIEKMKKKRFYIKSKNKIIKAYYRHKPTVKKIPQDKILTILDERNGLRYVTVDSKFLRGMIIPITDDNTIAYSRLP